MVIHSSLSAQSCVTRVFILASTHIFAPAPPPSFPSCLLNPHVSYSVCLYCYFVHSVGHKGRFGHEFMEFEIQSDGRFRYANNSHYKNDNMIRKEAKISKNIMEELKRIVRESEILREDDRLWPEANPGGRQELEIKLDNEHISFNCSKIGALADIRTTADSAGLTVFYYLVQDLKCLVLALISMHFKIKPIP